MEKIGLTIVTLIALIIVTPANSSGDIIGYETTATGQIVPDHNSSVFMKSQNISVSLSENIQEVTEYTLSNPLNSTIDLKLLLPFAGDRDPRAMYRDFPKPENLTLTVNDFQVSFQWTTFSWNNQDLNAIIFNVSFEAYEELSVVAKYNRTFKSRERDWSFEYLTMTGIIWNHPIEYARFEFNVSNEFEGYIVSGMQNYTTSIGKNNTTLAKEYYDWIPNYNIRIDVKNHHSRDNPFFWQIIFPVIIIGVLFISIFVFRIHILEKRKINSSK